MVQSARRRNESAIKDDRVALRLDDVTALSYPKGFFDMAVAIQSIFSGKSRWCV
jgi:intein-encoded DNA endonuclease-like protein